MSKYDKPSISLLCKLGSLIVHADEFMSPKGRPVDKDEFDELLLDPEVKEWMDAMNKEALLPVKR